MTQQQPKLLCPSYSASFFHLFIFFPSPLNEVHNLVLGSLLQSLFQEQVKQQKSLKGSDKQNAKARRSANNEVNLVLEKLEAMEQKYAHIEALVARLTLTFERFLDEKHVSGYVATYMTPDTKQVLLSFTTSNKF